MHRSNITIAADQVVFGAASAVPLIVIASTVGVTEFGRLALLAAGTAAIYGWLRSSIGEATLASQWSGVHGPRAAIGETCVVAAFASGLNSGIFAAFGGGTGLALLSFIVVPLLVCHDQMRYLAVADGRPGDALTRDLLWLVVALGSQGAYLWHGGVDGTSMYALWLSGVTCAFLAGTMTNQRPSFSWTTLNLVHLRPHLRVARANLLGVASSYSLAPLTIALSGPDTLGFLRIFSLWLTPLTMLGSLLPPIVLPRLAESLSQESMRRAWSFAAGAAGVVACLCALALLTVVDDMTTANLRGEKGYTWAALLSTLSVFITVVTGPGYLVLRVRRRFTQYSMVRTTWAIIFPLMVALGAVHFDLLGVVGASLACASIELALILGVLKRK